MFQDSYFFTISTEFQRNFNGDPFNFQSLPSVLTELAHLLKVYTPVDVPHFLLLRLREGSGYVLRIGKVLRSEDGDYGASGWHLLYYDFLFRFIVALIPPKGSCCLLSLCR